LVVELSALGHDVDTVPQEGLTGQADDASAAEDLPMPPLRHVA
jgi:hypothetical protein